MTEEERKQIWERLQKDAPIMAQLMKDAKRVGISFTLKTVEWRK